MSSPDPTDLLALVLAELRELNRLKRIEIQMAFVTSNWKHINDEGRDEALQLWHDVRGMNERVTNG